MHCDNATKSKSLCYHSEWLTTSGGCSSSPYQRLPLSSLHPKVTLCLWKAWLQVFCFPVVQPYSYLWPNYYVIIKIMYLLKAIKKKQQSAEYHDHTVRMWGYAASPSVLVVLLYKCWKGESVNSWHLQRGEAPPPHWLLSVIFTRAKLHVPIYLFLFFENCLLLWATGSKSLQRSSGTTWRSFYLCWGHGVCNWNIQGSLWSVAFSETVKVWQMTDVALLNFL